MAPASTIRLLTAAFLLPLTVYSQTTLTAEDCSTACLLYKSNIQVEHQVGSPNVFTPGTTLNGKVIDDFCSLWSDWTHSCAVCTSKSIGNLYDYGTLDAELLYSWDYTCEMYQVSGVGAAETCWSALPGSTSGCAHGLEAVSGSPASGPGSSTSSSSAAASSSASMGGGAIGNSGSALSVTTWQRSMAGISLLLTLAAALR